MCNFHGLVHFCTSHVLDMYRHDNHFLLLGNFHRYTLEGICTGILVVNLYKLRHCSMVMRHIHQYRFRNDDPKSRQDRNFFKKRETINQPYLLTMMKKVMLTIELNDPLGHISHRVGMNFPYKQQVYNLHVQLQLDCRSSYSLGIHCTKPNQGDFDRNFVDMVSMVLSRLVNRILVHILNDNDLLMVQPVGMCMYSMDMLDNL